MTDNPARPGSAGYDAEVRFGVVMYGGVSLAIYINGVANELNELARATPRPSAAAMIPELRPSAAAMIPEQRPSAAAMAPEQRPSAAATPDDTRGTRAVYRKLSRLVNDPPLVARYAAFLASTDGRPDPLDDHAGRLDAVWTRFVVDVIAGSSAGGINGLFLAKSLANDEPFAPLADLWVREGDLGGLLNDGPSYRDADMQGLPDLSARPASLLNSDRMYRKLRAAMRAMSRPATAPRSPPAPSPWIDELDLFVTTTDIRGALVTLRLFDKVVHERRHRQVFHFRYADDGRQVVDNDLAPQHEPFLAFAARCTSSFPFAFEPMSLADLPRLDKTLDGAALARWSRFFPGLPADEVAAMAHLKRAFGDGGYLDNKPFSHAVNALSHRASGVPVERKLVYVEPAPEHPERRADPSDKPDALSNALAALSTIPRYETIREDLEAVLRRNRRIERIDRIVRLGERDLDDARDDPLARVMADSQGQVPDWRRLGMAQMRAYYGDAFLPYSRLRQYTVTDDLADRLAQLWTLEPESDQVYAIRALVRAWRETRYSEQPAPTSPASSDPGNTGDAPAAPVPHNASRPGETLNAFLADFDLPYRVRRTAFLLRRTDQLVRLFVRRRRGPLHGLSEADQALASRLARLAGLDLDAALDDAVLLQALDALHRIKSELVLAYSQLRNAHAMPVDDAAEAAERAARRPELLGVLDLLLLRQEAPAPSLQTAAGAPMTVRFDDELLKLPSATRTLQEGIFLRARRLLELAREHRLTLLHDTLQADIGRIGAKISELINGVTGEPASGGRLVWDRLGQPRLEARAIADDRHRVGVHVDPTGVAALDTAPGERLRHFLGDYFLRFDTYDQMSFPLYYDTDSGEPATVEVLRISPEDAPSLIDESADPRRKLAGTALANFGAFLERRWRTNDILWGRLDGAERLIAALLPGPDPDSRTVRQALTREAQRSIVREGLMPEGRAELTSLLIGALAEVQRRMPAPGRAGDGPADSPSSPSPSPETLTAELLARLAPSSPAARRRLEQIVSGLLEDDALLAWVRASRDIDRTPDPAKLLDNASRAVTITGRLLETTIRSRGGELPALRWVARVGLAAQGLLAVSLPGSLRARWWSHGLKVLYAFELTMLAIGFGLGSEPVRTAALTALGITAALHLASLVVGDAVMSRRSWRAKSAWMAGVPVLLLAGLGVLALARLGWRALLGLG